MIYKVDWENADGVFAVPDRVADECLRLCNGKAAKLILYIMRNKSADTLDFTAIADALGISSEDVEDGISYWEQLGVIKKSGAASVSLPKSSEQPRESSENTPSTARTLERSTKMLSPKEIAECIEKSSELQFLFTETESLFGRLLNNTEQRTLIWMHDYYSLGTDLLLMIVGYCKTIGKLNVSYVDTIASDWNKKGISTHEQADAEILHMQSYHSLSSQVASRLGINRALISQETGYIKKWADMGMNIEMINEAYERSVRSTQSNKVSFAYINKILTEWSKSGIKTVADAQANDRKRVAANPATAEEKGGEHSYDLNLLLEHAMKNTPKIKKE